MKLGSYHVDVEFFGGYIESSKSIINGVNAPESRCHNAFIVTYTKWYENKTVITTVFDMTIFNCAIRFIKDNEV